MWIALGMTVGFVALGAAAVVVPAMTATYLIAVGLLGFVAYIYGIYAAFQDGSSGWAWIGISGPIIEITKPIFVIGFCLLMTERAMLKVMTAVYLISLIGVIVVVAANIAMLTPPA